MQYRKVKKKGDATSVVQGVIIQGQEGESRAVGSRTGRSASL